MAHQDYITRPPSQNKKNNPYKKKSAPEKQKITLKIKLIAVLTLILVVGFSYLLWALKYKTTEPSTAIESTPSTNNTTQKNAESTLPTPPKEKWSYVDQLKSKEVEVGEYEVNNKGPYQMQCGSFRTKKQAEVLKANIAFAGIEAQIRKAKGSSGDWYKVVLGPYARKRLAEKDKHKLSRNNVNYCQIWLWK